MKKVLLFVLILIAISTGIFLISKKAAVNKFTNTLSENPAKPVAISKGEVPSINFTLPSGYIVHTFAKNLGNARDMLFTPGGTLLVSDTAGNKVYALPDKNNDGIADENKVIITGEPNVHGLSFYQGKLYIADVNKVVKYNWDEAGLSASRDKVLFSLPYNTDHDNRTLVFGSDGKMFLSLGSTCDVCNIPPTTGGSVLISDAEGSKPQVFANGLRNAAFLAINPISKELWGTEMGRDHLGDDIPPDEINIIKQGNNYGWPNCYGNKIRDRAFNRGRSDPCGSTTPPIYEIPAHSAPLGLAFINSSQFPEQWQGDLLVSYHGSWNRTMPTGFKLVHLNVEGNKITATDDFMTGFQEGPNVKSAFARPVDLVFDNKGNLYVSDDKSGNVFIIQKIN